MFKNGTTLALLLFAVANRALFVQKRLGFRGRVGESVRVANRVRSLGLELWLVLGLELELVTAAAYRSLVSGVIDFLRSERRYVDTLVSYIAAPRLQIYARPTFFCQF